ncbi:MAG: hypothetical protein ACI9MR_002676 [Myxococcota bacterium]|jgi:hypothetical protein
MTTQKTVLKGFILVALPFALAACGTASWGAGGAFLVGALMAVPLLWSTRANSGPRLACTGYETEYCQSGRLQKHCCPRNAKCNYTAPTPYMDCGNLHCVDGRDVGRCPAPTPKIRQHGATADACGGAWQKACIDHVVQEACIAMVPTNYSGPSNNPRYVHTIGNLCTTHVLPSEGYPVKDWLIEPFCLGEWTKVCLDGKVSERCLPAPGKTAGEVGASKAPTAFPAATFVRCEDKTCAVGSLPAAVCPP